MQPNPNAADDALEIETSAFGQAVEHLGQFVQRNSSQCRMTAYG